MQPDEFAQQVNELTNHQWKLLEVLIKAGATWTSRRQIAQTIGKRRLIPYDIDCLIQLEQRELINIEKVHDDTPIGYQVVYRVSDQTIAALEQINALKEDSVV
ncbi:MAG: hypothetical protein AAFU54_18695 [Chloroflexota bacterium]